MVVPLRLWRQKDFYEAVANEDKLHFFYYGSLTVIILINLAVFLTLREKLYLFYALAIFGYLVFFASFRGFTLQHLYPNAPLLHAHVLLLSMPFLAIFSMLCCVEFLKIRSHSPRLQRALLGLLVFEIAFFLSAPLLDYETGVRIAAVSAFIFSSLLLVAGPIAWAQAGGDIRSTGWLLPQQVRQLQDHVGKGDEDGHYHKLQQDEGDGGAVDLRDADVWRSNPLHHEEQQAEGGREKADLHGDEHHHHHRCMNVLRDQAGKVVEVDDDADNVIRDCE